MIKNYMASSISRYTTLENDGTIAIGVHSCNTKRNTNPLLMSLFAVISIFFIGFTASAQVDLTATGGTPSQSYTTLKGAFDAINLGTHTGVISIGISGNTDETTFTAVLNASGLGGASYSGITINPTGGAARTISGATTAGAPLIDLNGADNVVFDGLNSGGNSLTIANTTVSAVSITSTIRFIGGATNNTITNCNVQGSGTMNVATNGAVIFFSTDALTANGNDNNTISNCNIGPAGANLPTKGILGNGSTSTTAIGNSNITITNNNIFDYFGAAVTSSGVVTNGGCNTWTITNNRFYQTGTRTWITGANHRAIDINNNTATSGAQGFTITGNTIGYASNTQTGTYTLTGFAGKFIGVFYTGFTGGALSDISSNTIANVSLTGVTSSGTGTASPFAAILVVNGVANTNNNTIGSQLATGSLVYSTTTTTATDVYGIYNFSLDNWTSNNNNIGGISVTNLGASGTFILYSMRSNTSTTKFHNATSNLIGGTVANSIQLNATGVSSQVFGISANFVAANISLNTIRNLTTNIGTGTTIFASMIGIFTSSTTPNHTISQNTIYNIGNTNTTADSVVTGIQMTGGTANVVERNFIYGLTNATTSLSGELNGIRVAGGTTIYRNNMIALGGNVSNAFGSAASNSSTSGINGFNGFLGTDSFFHNTIYIGGSATTGAGPSYAFNGTQVTNTRSFRDNIFVNNRVNAGATGTHYIIKMNGTTPAPTGLNLDNNLYFGAGTFGFYNSLDVTDLAAWKVAVGLDGTSFYGNPQLVNPNAAVPDLHINPSILSFAEGNGSDIGVALDFDGETRSGLTPVDIGADAGNFIGTDLAPPSMNYAVLGNTGLITNRSLSVTISDLTGVNNNPGSRPRIYYNKNAGANFSTEATLSSGTVTNGVWTCTIDNTLIGGVVPTDVIRYFVVAQDVLGNLVANPNSGFVGTNVNTITTPPTTPNAYTIVPSFNGVINVGSTEAYTSLTNTGGLFEALNGGALSGNVTINITSDLLTELGTVALNQWPEDGAGNYTLLIKPSGGARNIAGNIAGALIKINGADRVTIDGSTTGATAGSCLVGGDAALRELTIQNANVGTTACVIAVQSGTNGAQNNTIKNVNVLGQSPTTTLVGISLGGNTPNTIGVDNDNNRVENCAIKRVINGIYSSGQNVTNQNTGTVITKNDLSATGADRINRVGIVVFSENGITISYNSVGGIVSSESADAIGIAVGTNAISVTSATSGTIANAIVDSNKINGVSQDNTYSAAGITLAGDVVGTNTISNNMISGIIGDANGADFIAGIFVTGGAASNAKLYYNTVSLTGDRNSVLTPAATQYPSYAVAIVGSDLIIELKNNILLNTQFVDLVANPNAKSYAIGMSSVTFVNLDSNFNDFWSAGTNDGGFRSGSLTIAAGTDYASLALWSAAVSDDANSVEIEPFFTSASDLHIIAANNLSLINLGTPLAAVTNDFDCFLRDAAAPDMGADESGCTTAVGGTATALVTTFCVSGSTTVSVSGYSTGETTSYQWQSSADVGFTTPINMGSPSATYTDLTTGTISTTTFYRLAVTCDSNSQSSFSAVATVTVNVTPPVSFSSNISVTITGSCNNLGGVYNDIGLLNGKKSFDLATNPNYHISFDGVKWVLWTNSITNIGFQNTNVPAGLYPPTTGWVSTQCGGGSSLTIVIASDTVSLCAGATVNNLFAVGTNLQWYDVPSNGVALASSTLLSSGTYYVTQTINSCESARAPVFVSVNPIPTTPIISSNSPVCEGNALNLTASTVFLSGYTMNGNSGASFVDINATGTSVGTISDDSEHNITIPLFTFNGVPYTSARVGNNGLIVFGSTAGEIVFGNQSLPSTANSAGNIFLAPYWDDLFPNSAIPTSIKTQTIGNVFIIQYTQENHFDLSTLLNTITFQVQLNLVTGVIHYVYQDVLFGNSAYDAGITATIGIQTSSTSALQYSFNTASLVNGQSITFTPNLPTYAWSGPNGFTSALQNPSIPNVTAAAAGTYSLIVTNPVTGCSTEAVTTTVTLNPKPTTPTISSNSPVCAGNALNLTAPTVSYYAMNGNSGVSFVDIDATGTSVGTLSDDSEHNITIPSFTFNGVPYTTARVGNNGLIVFGSTAGEIVFGNQSLPSTANSAGNIFLAPYWDDLFPNSAIPTSIKTQTVGNLFIIQYKEERHFDGSAGPGTITFQVQLDTTTGAIHYVYQDVLFGNSAYDAGITATIGIQTSSTSALQYSFNTASLVNGQSITFTPNLPTYAWSGPNGFASAIQNPSIPNVTAAAAGTYSLIVTNPLTGCPSVAATINVTVPGLGLPLTITQTGTTTLCNQQSVQLCSSQSARSSAIYALAAFGGSNSIAKYNTNFTTHTLTYDNTYTGPSSDTNYGIDRNPVTGEIFLIKQANGRRLFTIDLTTNTLVDKGVVLSSLGNNYVQDFTFDNDGVMYVVFNNGTINKIDYNSPTLTPTPFTSGLQTGSGGVGLTYDFDANRLLYTTGAGTYNLYQINSVGTVSFMFSFSSGSTSQALEYVGNNTCYVSGTGATNAAYRLDLLTQATNLVLTPLFNSSVKDLMYVPGVTLAWSDGVSSLGTTTCINVNPSSTTTYTLTLTNTDFGCSATTTHIVTVAPCNSVVNLKLYIEGYYLGGGLMATVQNNQDFPDYSLPLNTNVELITVELRDATTYALVTTTTAMLQTNGTAVCTFPTAPSGSFYIAVKTRTTVQTWSKLPQNIGAIPMSYDFTTAATQAYGDNQASLVGGVFGFYSGDIDSNGAQDDEINASDYSQWEADSNAFLFGSYPTDLNGDGEVNASDYSIWEGNANGFVFALYPM